MKRNDLTQSRRIIEADKVWYNSGVANPDGKGAKQITHKGRTGEYEICSVWIYILLPILDRSIGTERDFCT